MVSPGAVKTSKNSGFNCYHPGTVHCAANNVRFCRFVTFSVSQSSGFMLCNLYSKQTLSWDGVQPNSEGGEDGSDFLEHVGVIYHGTQIMKRVTAIHLKCNGLLITNDYSSRNIWL